MEKVNVEDDDVEWVPTGECDVCGAIGTYKVPEIGDLCPNCVETFTP